MRRLPVIAFVLLSAISGGAHAYIDPNAGGWLFQLLFPLLIAIAGAWAVLRQKIAQFFSRIIARLRGK